MINILPPDLKEISEEFKKFISKNPKYGLELSLNYLEITSGGKSFLRIDESFINNFNKAKNKDVFLKTKIDNIIKENKEVSLSRPLIKTNKWRPTKNAKY